MGKVMEPADLDREDGKKAAMEALAERRAEAKEKGRIDNSALPVGSPIYYYCQVCGLLADTLAEGHASKPFPFCNECAKMVNAGFSTLFDDFVDWELKRCPLCGGSGRYGYDHQRQCSMTCKCCNGERSVKVPIAPINSSR